MYLTGDFVPQKTTPVLPDFGAEEWVLTNLEGPVCSDALRKSIKAGVHLHSAPFSVNGKWAFSLANNHIMDFGIDGLKETMEFLTKRSKKHDTMYAGAGINESEAKRPMYFVERGRNVAVFSCCERQFGAADEDVPGVALKGEWLNTAIPEAKRDGADIVVVSCHCASEFSPFVNPKLQEYYRRLIDSGADIIHGHHSHVPQGWEEYKGRPIFYGLGNFVVDRDMWAENPNNRWSLVVHINFLKNGLSWEVTPFGDVPESSAVYLKAINTGFKKPCLLESLWQEVSVQLYHRLYEQTLRAFPAENVKLDFRSRIRKLYFAAKDIIGALSGESKVNETSLNYARAVGNYFQCESHVDVISTALGVLNGSVVDKRTPETAKIIAELMP